MRGGFPWGIGRRLAGVRTNKSCMELTIREERPDDCRTVGELVEAAFRPLAFSDHTEHLLVARLRRSEAFVPGLSLVAEAEGRLVGHVLLTRLEVVAEDRSAATVLGVAPLSVLPGLQNRGIGSALLREAHRRAVRAGFGAALLVGHADYYPRFGYVPASRFGIRFPFDAPDACCLAAELVPGSVLRGDAGSMTAPAVRRLKTGEAHRAVRLPFLFAVSGIRRAAGPPSRSFLRNPAVGIYSTTSSNWSLPTPQSGHTQSSGISSKAVPGAMPPSGSPTAGS